MRPKSSLFLLFATLFCVVAIPAASQDLSREGELHPGIIGQDARVRLDAQGAPWDAIGQVNVAGLRVLGQCTGTLVAPTLVLTAAHCVMNPTTGKPFPPMDIHFLAGVRGGENKGVGAALCLHFLPTYRYDPRALQLPPAQRNPLKDLASDVVVIVLASKLNVDPAPIDEDATPQPGLRLTHVAYPADHRFEPWVHYNCRLLNSDLIDGLWFNDCDTHPGSSGGPVFTRTGEKYRVAAIMLAVAHRLFNVALPVTKWLDLTYNAVCP